MALSFPARDRDDYIQVGRIGLLKAIRSYDKDRGAAFSTYAHRCIKNEMVREYHKNKKHKLTITTDKFDHIPAPSKMIIDTEGLSSDEKTIVDMRLNYETFKNIASTLGYSRNKVRKIMRNIGKKI